MAADASAFSSSNLSSFSVSDDADEYSVSDAVISQSSGVPPAVLLPLRLTVRVVWSPLRLRDSISITEDSGGSAKRTFLCRAAAVAALGVLVGRLYRRESGSKSPLYVTVEWYDTVGVITGRRFRRDDGDDEDDDDDAAAAGGLRGVADDNRRSVQPFNCI